MLSKKKCRLRVCMSFSSMSKNLSSPHDKIQPVPVRSKEVLTSFTSIENTENNTSTYHMSNLMNGKFMTKVLKPENGKYGKQGRGWVIYLLSLMH